MVQNSSLLLKEALSRKNMGIFSGALLILLGVATYIFGLHVLALAAVSITVSIAIEYAFAKLRKKELGTSFLVTPLVFTLILPPTLPLWIAGVGIGFGTFFGKAIFGGHGKNIFNPALVGYLFITISFPAFMNTMWLNPQTDMIATATPLGTLNRGLPFTYETLDLFLGNVPGTLGETFRLGILLLGFMLILLKVIDWRTPLFYLGSFFVISFLGELIAPQSFVDPFLSMIVGGLLFGAFFVATDPVTSPVNGKGRMLYGVGLGLLTVIIRNFAAFPEGVTFAVILMNAIAPIIDSMTVKPEKLETVEASS